MKFFPQQKKAFLHWYTNEGVDPEVFNQAKANVQALITEYADFSEEADDDDAGDPKKRKSRQTDQYGGVMFK